MLSYPQDFGVTEDHTLLRSSARSFLAERSSRQTVRRIVEGGGAFDRDTWKAIEELGWLGLVVPEERGGAGLGALHLSIVLEEMGRALLPSPFLEHTLAAIALGHDEVGDFVADVAAGATSATFAHAEPHGSADPADVRATCERDGDEWILRGDKVHVMNGREADLWVAPFRDGDRLELFAIWARGETEALEIEDEVSVDPTRPAVRARFDGLRIDESQRLACDAAVALRDVALRGALALAAEMVGGAETLLLMTRDYANEREQFGKKIGSFQAVKHPIVDTMIDVEQTRTLVYAASAALDAGSADAPALCRMAKAMASEAYPEAARRAVQLHGGFGFTWECDVHFWLKRALWSRPTLGDARHHRARLLAEGLLDPE